MGSGKRHPIFLAEYLLTHQRDDQPLGLVEFDIRVGQSGKGMAELVELRSVGANAMSTRQVADDFGGRPLFGARPGCRLDHGENSFHETEI
jgi:hypothetical protein